MTFQSCTGFKKEFACSTARLILHNNTKNVGERFRWPKGAEDLHFDYSTGRLWCLTEFNQTSGKTRWFFSVLVGKYQKLDTPVEEGIEGKDDGPETVRQNLEDEREIPDPDEEPSEEDPEA